MLAALLYNPPGAHAGKAGPRIPAIQRFGFPGSPAVAMAPGNPCSNTSRLQSHCCLVGTDDSSLLALLPQGYPQHATQCQEPATTQPSEPQAPDLLYFGTRRLPSPQSTEAHHSLLSLTATEPPLPLQRTRTPNSILRKDITCHSAGDTRSPVLHTAPPCRKVTFLLSKSWNPSYSTEWQSSTLLVLGGPPPRVHRDPTL
jgi:hypothetical protein